MIRSISTLLLVAILSCALWPSAGQAGQEVPQACKAPNGYIPYIAGLYDTEMYVPSWEPNFNSYIADGTYLFLAEGDPVLLAEGEPVILARNAKEACRRLISGSGSYEDEQVVQDAVFNNQIWWKVNQIGVYAKGALLCLKDGNIYGIGDENCEFPKEPFYVSAKHLAFEEYKDWLYVYGPKYGILLPNHTVSLKIWGKKNLDSEFAELLLQLDGQNARYYCLHGYASPTARAILEAAEKWHKLEDGVSSICADSNEFGAPVGYIAPPSFVNCKEEFASMDLEAWELASPTGAGQSYVSSLAAACPREFSKVVREYCASSGECFTSEFENILCKPEERALFACKIDGSNKRVSVCEGGSQRAYCTLNLLA